MPINKQALDRLQGATFTSESIVEVLKILSRVADLTDSTAEIRLDYQKEDDKVADGDLIPFIVIGLRPAEVPGDNS